MFWFSWPSAPIFKLRLIAYRGKTVTETKSCVFLGYKSFFRYSSYLKHLEMVLLSFKHYWKLAQFETFAFETPYIISRQWWCTKCHRLGTFPSESLKCKTSKSEVIFLARFMKYREVSRQAHVHSLKHIPYPNPTSLKPGAPHRAFFYPSVYFSSASFL